MGLEAQRAPVEVRAGHLLKSAGLTIATAESCTGGLIGHLLTEVPGSSSYMLGGMIAYDNTIKMRLLSVKEATLIAHGAVSQQVAAEMALGARALFGTDYAVSVTGIAGPGGGTDEKPVGLTFIGLAGPDELLEVERYVWSQDRTGNKRASAEAALALVVRVLEASGATS
ncbi:MAG: CinA family protein [Chloroflexota bacterium]